MLPPGHVVIVEDDNATREMLAALVAAHAFQPIVAEDGLEALHVLRAVRHRSPGTPCVVLLDLAMPRLSGHEFRRAQLADPIIAGVPVIVMSGAVDARPRAAALGAVATLTKPLDIHSVISVVRRHCAVTGDSPAPPPPDVTDFPTV
jgi:DNA-binding response OmpR family regulator